MYKRILFIFVLFFFFSICSFFFLRDSTSTIGNAIGFWQLNDKKRNEKNTHRHTKKKGEKISIKKKCRFVLYSHRMKWLMVILSTILERTREQRRISSLCVVAVADRLGVRVWNTLRSAYWLYIWYMYHRYSSVDVRHLAVKAFSLLCGALLEFARSSTNLASLAALITTA